MEFESKHGVLPMRDFFATNSIVTELKSAIDQDLKEERQIIKTFESSSQSVEEPKSEVVRQSKVPIRRSVCGRLLDDSLHAGFLVHLKSLDAALIGLVSAAALEVSLGGVYGKFNDWFRVKAGVRKEETS
jgi:hypothetical protein